jgi:hypothetical protein
MRSSEMTTRQLDVVETVSPLRIVRLLHAAFRAVLFAGSMRAAHDAIEPPPALAFPLSRRARRHIRTARVSWW